MDDSNDPNLHLPGGMGLIKFPPVVRWHLFGDEQAADQLRGVGSQLMAQLDRGNVNNLNQCSAVRQYDDGRKVEVVKCYNFYDINITCPVKKGKTFEEAPQLVPQLEKGQFYWVPGCKARYDGVDGGANCIPDGKLAGEMIADLRGSDDTKSTQQWLSRKDAGLPSCGISAGGIVARNYGVFVLPGDATTTEGLKAASGLHVTTDHIPMSGSFSISCVARLNKKLEYDYSFSDKTDELNCGYTVWNPIKPRVLSSPDGKNWASLCPGSISPLIGSLIPSRFSSHYANFTYPWPVYNTNFVSNEIKYLGFREIGTICSDEPLLISDYASSSPYWDKIETGTLETLDGEFIDSWDENTDINNSAPYASYCKFKINGDHKQKVGTRAVATSGSDEKRYATVVSVKEELDSDGSVKDVILTLKDYQYKLYINNFSTSITFGDQPFPVCHPQGYMIGINYIGLFWFNGNRILAGKICDFESEYQYNAVMSDELELGAWYHICMTYQQDDSNNTDLGETKLYVTKLGDNTINIKSGMQSTGEFYNYSDTGVDVTISSGLSDWNYAPSKDSQLSDWVSAWTFSSVMDIGLPRFYHRTLSIAEAQLLTQEVFNGVFVADDFEANILMGLGFHPIMATS